MNILFHSKIEELPTGLAGSRLLNSNKSKIQKNQTEMNWTRQYMAEIIRWKEHALKPAPNQGHTQLNQNKNPAP